MNPTDMQVRQSGYYWVRYTHEWLIAEWFENEWTLFHAHGKLDDRHFDEIDENRIERRAVKCIVEGCGEKASNDTVLCEDHFNEYIDDTSPIGNKKS